MACTKLVSFGFVEGDYTLKMTKQEQKHGAVKAKITYRNELNALSFLEFTAMDFNIFFTICYFLIQQNKNKSGFQCTKIVKVKFDDLRIFMPDIKNKQRFFKEISKFVRRKLKLIGVDTLRYNSEVRNNKDEKCLNDGQRELEGSVFFKRWIVSEAEEELYLEVTSYAYSMLREFGNFMSFDMNEFCSFENKYTKSLFRLLKQYENSNSHVSETDPDLKEIFMSKGEFVKFMNAPDDYKSSHLDCKVIDPSLKELNLKSSSYKNLCYEKLYDLNDKVKKVKGFKIIFEKKYVK